jgi:hypothetical protein
MAAKLHGGEVRGGPPWVCRRPMEWAAGLAGALVLATPGVAGEPGASPSPGAPVAQGLAGPSVGRASGEGEQPTIVRRLFGGEVERHDELPEVVALRALKLSPEEERATQEILVERSRVLDQFVLEQLDQLIELSTSMAAGDRRGAAKAGLSLIGALEGLHREGSLPRRLRAVLSAENRARFQRLLDEYWNALVEERLGAGDSTQGRVGVLLDERLKSFGREVERAFRRQLASGGLITRYLADALHLTQEQACRVRELADEFMRQTGGEPTEAQRVSYLLRLNQVLDSEQRKALGRLLRFGQ